MEDARATLEKRRRRRVLLALFFVLLPFALLGGAWLFLQSGAGEALVRRQVLDAVAQSLAGKLEVGELELEGEHLVLTDLKLFTPEGELVASIERLEADVTLSELANQRVVLDHVRLTRPELFLKEDARGWNLTRAVAARTPSPAAAPSGPNPWRVRVRDLKLTEGLFDLQQEDRRLTATKLWLEGNAGVRLDPLEVTADGTLRSALTAPLAEQLEATLSASADGGPQRYGLTASLGGTRVRGTVELPKLDVTLEELVAAPPELRAFVPGWPLVQPLFAKGTLSPRQAALTLSAGKARVTVQAKYDLDAHVAEQLSLSARDVDLRELVDAPMASLLSLEVKGALSDWRPETLTGALQASGSWAAKGQPLASLDLDARAEQGEARVRKLELESPGVAFTTRGSASLEQLSLFGVLEAKDLSQVARTLSTFAGVDVPGLSGNGRVQVSVLGPVRGPAVKAVGELHRLSVAGLAAEQLELSADLPNLFKPLDAQALVHARRMRLGERAVDEVTLDFLTHGRELDVDLATKGLGDLQVHAVGTLDKDSRGAQLSVVELRSTEAHWALEAPTRVAWEPRLTVAPFVLRDGAQALGGRLEVHRSQLDAQLHVERLDLSRLPRIVAPPELGLGGTLTADVTAQGRVSKPAVSGTVSLREGRVKGFEGVSADVNGGWKDERATGRASVAAALGRLEGTFDLPVLAFLDEKPVPGTARLTVTDLQLSELGRRLEQELPADGVLSGVVELTGTGAQPKLTVTATAPTLGVRRGETLVPLQNVELVVKTDEQDRLRATLDLTGLGGRQALTLQTPLTLPALRREPPGREALLALPVTLGVELRAIDLHQLQQLGLVAEEGAAGSVDVSGTLHGPARAPTGQVVVSFAQVAWPPLQRVDGRVTFRTDDAGLSQLTADVAVAKQPAASLTATVSALPERALAALLGPRGDVDAMIDALADVPVEARLELQPFDLSQALARREDKRTPGGAVSASLAVKGTLEAPTAELRGALKDLRFDRVALGSARFQLDSTPTQQRFTVALGGQGRDDFKAKGSTGLDLRLSALRKGLKWKQAPVDVTAESRNFDLGFLSGATDTLRVVAGRLDLTGRVQGTLGAPGFEGDARVRQGRVALAGNGDYRNVELALKASDTRFELERLEATSGAGKAELVATGVKQASGAWLLKSSGKTEKFAIVNDDQLMASVSLKYALEGDVSATLADIRSLELPRVEVTLPEVKRKDLQDLERPADIIVLRGGARATKQQRAQTRKAAVSAQEKTDGFVLRALIDAPRNIWVKSSDVNLEVGLSEGFRVEYRDGTRLFGEAKVVQGNLQALGREFTIQKGSEVRFAGPAAQPYVNVTALHTNTREQVKITVTVAGRGTDVTFKATSEPPMPESDIYAVLATGRRNLKNSGGAAFSPGQAASVVGQLVAGQMKDAIGKVVPIDVFNFETSDNFEKMKIDVGKYLSDSLFIGASMNIGARRERGENVWAGRLEYQVTRSVSLEAYAGDALSFGADAMWSKDF